MTKEEATKETLKRYIEMTRLQDDMKSEIKKIEEDEQQQKTIELIKRIIAEERTKQLDQNSKEKEATIVFAGIVVLILLMIWFPNFIK
jgi:predicted nucleic acid-binding Zn ribbon protein